MKLKYTPDEIAQMKEHARREGYASGFWAAEKVYRIPEDLKPFFMATEDEVKNLLSVRVAIESDSKLEAYYRAVEKAVAAE